MDRESITRKKREKVKRKSEERKWEGKVVNMAEQKQIMPFKLRVGRPYRAYIISPKVKSQ